MRVGVLLLFIPQLYLWKEKEMNVMDFVTFTFFICLIGFFGYIALNALADMIEKGRK